MNIITIVKEHLLSLSAVLAISSNGTASTLDSAQRMMR